jgi:hypothetical protein
VRTTAASPPFSKHWRSLSTPRPLTSHRGSAPGISTAPNRKPNRRRPASIRLSLRFRERSPGEWDGLADTPLGGLLRSAGERPRAIVLEIHAAAEPGQDETVAKWRLRAEGAPRNAAVTAPAALASLRRLNPLVWLHGGGLVGVSALPPRTPTGARPTASETARLAARIQQSQAELVTGTAPDLQAILGQGFEAARDFIALNAQHLDSQSHNFREMVAELLDQRQRLPGGGAATSGMRFMGSSAERIGVLALLAALLRALPDNPAPGAEPIWLIEDPEAQLHPMTLASVLTMVSRVSWQKIITTQSPEVLAAEPCWRAAPDPAGRHRPRVARSAA